MHRHDGTFLKSWLVTCMDRNEDVTHEIFVRHSTKTGAFHMAIELLNEYIYELANLEIVAFELNDETMTLEEEELCLRCIDTKRRSYNVPVTKDNNTGKIVHYNRTIANRFYCKSMLKFWEAYK